MTNYRLSRIQFILSETPYDSGDVIGGRFLLDRLLASFEGRKEGGYVIGARLLNIGTNNPNFRLHLFTTPLTIPADNEALAFDEAELRKCPHYHVVEFEAEDAVEIASGIRMNEQYRPGLLPVAGGVYGVLQPLAGYTPTATDDLTLWVYVDAL